MNLFQKTLGDIVKGARFYEGDITTYNSQVMNEIKEEFKSKDYDVKTAALIKILYFHHESSNLEWSAFNVLDCMSSSSPEAKKIGYIMASLVIPTSPDAMIMCTNLFKKGIKSNVTSDISLMLSCLGNICTVELGGEVINQILNHCHNSKTLIRKKAFATLRSIYEENPNLIPKTIEKVISRITDEKDPSVMATIFSLLFTVLKQQPKLHPLLIKPLYALLDQKKNNWALIKLIKLFDILLELEPRLKKKLCESYLKLFSTINAKSVEIELINTVFKHFKEYEDLYKRACFKLKAFIESPDPNLKTLGLQSLKTLLQNDKEIFEDYYEFLLDSFSKGDQLIKTTISGIFEEYLDKKNIEQAVNIMISALDGLSNNYSVLETMDALIKSILGICSKNCYSNIEDCEWFMLEVLKPLLLKAKKEDTMTLALNTLVDFTLRVDEIKEIAVQFGLSILSSIENNDINLHSRNQSPFICKNKNLEEFQMSPATRILEMVLFMFGEYSPKIRDIEQFFSVVNSLSNLDSTILKDVNGPLEMCLVKMCVSLTKYVLTDNFNCEDLEIVADIDNKNEKIVKIIEDFMKIIFRLFKRTLNFELDKIGFCKNEYMAILLNSFGLQEDTLQAEKIEVTSEAIIKCGELDQIIFNKIKPMTKNAQDLIKIPVELRDVEIELSAEEKLMIEAFQKEMSEPITKVVPPLITQETRIKKNYNKTVEKDDEKRDEQNDENEQNRNEEHFERAKPIQQKVKREFKVITDEERPLEVVEG